MPTELPRALIAVNYCQPAQDYLRSLPPEHFMEAITQSTQHKITLESLDLVAVRRPDFHLFSELLVQYPLPDQKRPGQVVPDNMVVLHEGPLKVEGSYDVPLQPARPYWMLEYVSRSNRRKDYDDNMQKYERELKVPYYLLFYPDDQELTLYRHNKRKYISVKPNADGRLALRELELEMGLLEGWTRFWFRGELLPLPADLLVQFQEAQRERDAALRQSEEFRRERDEAREELARLRKELQARDRPGQG
jgi:hypothetical protein